jgi:hypothetical protein
MGDYTVVDPSEHGDIHRGYVKIGDLELNVTITHEGLIIDLYDDNIGSPVGTFANTFLDLAEFVETKV